MLQGNKRPGRELVALMALAMPASTLLWWPQFGDQALFQQGGRLLADGAVYWRDFWDVKQPGIFWLYGLSERAGAGVLGVRLIEWVLVLLSAVVVSRICSDWELEPGTRVVAPFLVLAPYVLTADANGVGQVEGLVTLPVLLQYWAGGRAFAAGGRAEAARWAAVAGLCAAVVGVLKLLYLPLGLVAVAAARSRPAEDRGHRNGVVIWAGWAVPVAVSGLAVAGYAAAHHMLRLALYSTFQAPAEQLAGGLHSTSAILFTLRALLVAVTLTAPLAAIAVLTAVRQGRARREAGLVVWLLTAALLAAPQLPTSYRVMILLSPLGLLAALGLDRVRQWAARRLVAVRVVVVVTLAVTAVPLLPGAVRLVGEFASNPSDIWLLADEQRLAVGDRIGGSPVVDAARLMRETIRPGSAIYVLGDPVVYRVLDTRQAIEMNGWGPEIMSERMWAETVRELQRSRPEWIFVESTYQPDVDRVPALLDLLNRSYTRVDRPGASGTWWHTESPGRSAPSPEGNLLGSLR